MCNETQNLVQVQYFVNFHELTWKTRQDDENETAHPIGPEQQLR
jgi:hypothetical protein